jgi:uncharacterized protein (TIGR00725 family)
MKTLVGVMGPGDEAREEDLKNAFEVGRLIAQAGWVLLSGGRDAGVMDAVSKGAKVGGGLTIGVIPTDNKEAISPAVDVAILTGMGSARNNINVLSSDAVIACGMGAGTASEVALALKAKKKVVLLGTGKECEEFFKKLEADKVFVANTPQQAVATVKEILAKQE